MKKPESLQKISFVVHGVQAAFVFIVFIILLVIKAQKGNDPGQTNFMFAMCFLSVPLIIYLAMTPRFPRTAKFANPVVFLALGALFTILWFSAFVAVAAINQNGINGGKSSNTTVPTNATAGTCDTTTVGTPKTCEVAKVAIGFGAITFILFGITTALAGYIVHYLWSNSLPFDYFSTSSHHTTADIVATTGDAFSHKDDPEDHDHEMGAGPTTNYALLAHGGANAQRYDHDDGESDTGYTASQYSQNTNHGVMGGGHPGYDVNEPVDFPDAPYERGGRREY